jgi:hypothetical protein
MNELAGTRKGTMATQSWEDIINAIPDESDRGQVAELANKYPDLRGGWLRQSDYSRQLDSLKPVKEELSQWQSWAESNWDFENNAPKAELYWRNRAQELENSKGDEMTFDDIGKYIAEKGVITKDVLSAKEQEFGNHIQGTAYFAVALNEKAAEYQHEFGKPFKARDFAAKMAQSNAQDIDDFFDKYVAEDRNAIRQQKDQEREAKIRAEEREKTKQEILSRQVTSQYPVESDAPQMGHLEAKIKNLAAPDALDKAQLGQGTLAAIAAAEYRKQQAGLTE